MDVALPLLRLTIGALLGGHGAQKLFGWFDGHGVRRTADWHGRTAYVGSMSLDDPALSVIG